MIMGLLARGLGALFGGGALVNIVTIPALVFGCLWFANSWVEERDRKLLKQGEMICQADWEQKLRDGEQAKAKKQIEEMQAQAEAERQSADGLREELQTVRGEMDALRSSADSANDRCLSDGVFDTLRTRQSTSKGGPKKRPPAVN